MTPWGASSSASESEDDAPETFSFNSSKKAAKGVEHARQEYEANERRKRKEANRERDRRLKERAEAKEKEKEAAASSKRKTRDRKVKQPASEKSDDESEGGDAAGPRNELEARMARAMREAEQESEQGDGGEDDEEATGSASDGSADEEDASEHDSDAQNSESESGSSQSGSEEEEEEEPEAPAHPKRMPSAPAYLPDELFKAAFSKAASSSKRRLDAEDEPNEASPRPRKQRKPAKRVGKDITVGSRTIRTLTPVNPAVPTTIPRAMVPPRTVNKFVKRSLNLKGKAQAAQAKGWQRRKANVGVMKRNGPAANFARNGGYT